MKHPSSGEIPATGEPTALNRSAERHSAGQTTQVVERIEVKW